MKLTLLVSSSSYVNNEPEQFPSDNVEGLQPVIEVQQKSTIDITIGFDFLLTYLSRAWSNSTRYKQSLMSLPNDSRLPFLPSSEIQSNMIEINVGQEKQAGKKYPCPEPDCTKSYTQFHNLKSHRRKKHNSI